MQLVQSRASVREDGDKLTIVRQQEITKDFLDEIHSERMATSAIRAGEHMRVAAVPTAVVDLWIAQGVPFYDLSAREIVQRLRADGLEAFVTTDKRV